MRPLIGVTTYRERARWGVWDTAADLLPSDYAISLEVAGGVPVLLPPMIDSAEAAAAVVARLDGLVISGGADVGPGRYGQEQHPRTTGWREDRDAWELALLDAAETPGLPTLGICRGMQVMAVHAGGSLHQHTPDLLGHENHGPGADQYGATVVETAKGSRLSELIGDKVAVHCHHHQSVAEYPGFVPAGHAADGLLEAMELPGDRFCVAVQWHPEVDADAGLFHALVEAARRAGTRG